MNRTVPFRNILAITASVLLGALAPVTLGQELPPSGKPTAPPSPSKLTPSAGPVVTEAKQVVVAEPQVIDLGVFSTTETGKGELTLRNTASGPVTIRSAKGDCGCTTIDFKRNTVLAPGETTTVTVNLRGGPVAKVMQKNVRFTIDGYPQLRVAVKGESINYVKMTPSAVGPESRPDGKIVLESIDGQPFKITRTTPEILKRKPVEARTRHEVVIDWDTWKDAAVNGKVTFYFEGHPRCKSFFTNLDLSRADRTQIQRNVRQKREAGSSQAKVKPAPPASADLFTLVRQGRVAVLSTRLKDTTIDLEKRDATGLTPLCLAAKSGNLQVVRMLLDAGAFVDGSDRVERTPLMHAMTARNVDVIRLLIEQGADVNARDAVIGGPLAWASGFGDAQGVQILLDEGAELETLGTATGYTPLIWASGFGDYMAIPMLLEAGANIEVRDAVEGATPLMHAARTGKVGGMKSLIDAGANVNARDRNSRTPLIVAAGHSSGTVEKIRLLLDRGAAIDHADALGETALDAARSRSDAHGIAIVEFLQGRMPAEDGQDK